MTHEPLPTIEVTESTHLATVRDVDYEAIGDDIYQVDRRDHTLTRVRWWRIDQPTQCIHHAHELPIALQRWPRGLSK